MILTVEQVDRAARAAYEKVRKLKANKIPEWKDLSDFEQMCWRSAVTAAFAAVEKKA